MPAVSDTSPILGLSAIGHLELLQEQFGAVFIPQAVLAELKNGIKNGWCSRHTIECKETGENPLPEKRHAGLA